MNTKDRIVWTALILFISPFIAYFVPQIMGLNAHIVDSGSMRPTMPPGSALFSQPADAMSLEEGDVIVFRPNRTRMDEELVAHRIIDKREGNYTRWFRTMGDANTEADPGWTPAFRVIGEKVFSIPYLGTLITRFKSPLAILVMVGIPSAILIQKEFTKILDALEDEKEKEEPKDRTIYFQEKKDKQNSTD